MTWTRLISQVSIVLGLFSVLTVLLVSVSGQQLTPGPQIAYLSKLDGANWHIYLMDIQRGLAYNLTRAFHLGPMRNRLPAWSPDGKELAFVSEVNRRTGLDILLVNPDTQEMRFFANSVRDETSPAWSPRGVGSPRIAYEVFNGRAWDIYVRRLDEDNIVLIQDMSELPFVGGWSDDRMPRWSPDGTMLSFVSDREGRIGDLYLIDANGRNLRRLTTGINVMDTVVWSPTGTHIAFVTNLDANREIYLVNVNSGAITNLTRNPATDYAPVWSPDGTQIAFVSNRAGHDNIYVMDITGDNVRRLTDSPYHSYEPAWSPDGNYLVYVSLPGFVSEIYLIDVEGTSPRRLTRNIYDDWYPVWRP